MRASLECLYFCNILKSSLNYQTSKKCNKDVNSKWRSFRYYLAELILYVLFRAVKTKTFRSPNFFTGSSRARGQHPDKFDLQRNGGISRAGKRRFSVQNPSSFKSLCNHGFHFLCTFIIIREKIDMFLFFAFDKLGLDTILC